MHNLEDIPSSMSNLNVRNTLKFLHKSSIKDIIQFSIEFIKRFIIRHLNAFKFRSQLLQFIYFDSLCAFMHSLEDIPSSMSDLNIRDSLKFLHRNSIKNRIHNLAIKRSCFFLRSFPLTNMSSGLLPSVFNEVLHSLINRFQECFHPYFPINIIIPIKVRRNNQRVSVFHDNRGQGLALRSKDLQQESNLL